MAKKNECDYLIKFPTSRNAKWMEREPVVLLFGWAGCKNRYLDKYVQLYSLQGCTTYQFTCHSYISFWRQDKLKSLVETMADEFVESGYGEHPILFHVFSNGGCYVLLHFLQYFRQRQRSTTGSGYGDIDLRGLVFDSGPALGDSWTRANAYAEAVYGGYGPIFKRLLIGFWSVVFSIYNWYNWITSWFSRRPFSGAAYGRLLKLDLRCPMLFLYSKADNICKYTSIESFVEKQRQRGVQTTAVRFDDSPHCQHGRFHANEYNDAVRRFLYQVMGAAPSPSPSKKSKSGTNGDNENESDFVRIDNGDKSDQNDTDDFEITE